MRGRLASAALAALLAAAPAAAQLQTGAIRGAVSGADGSAVRGAVVQLRDPLGAVVRETRTTDAGEFSFDGLAPGRFSLRAVSGARRSPDYELTVGSALPIEIDVRLVASPAEELVVTGSADDLAAARRVSLAGETLRAVAERVGSRTVQAIVATTPGWGTEDNGVLHVRGVDDGFLFVIDGVPVYDRLDALFAPGPDRTALESVHVLTGYIPPEYGLKSGGVIELRSQVSAVDRWSGALEAEGGSFRTGSVDATAVGPITRRAALRLHAGGHDSSRFLDPVHPDNLHNRGGTSSWAGGVDWTPTSRDTVHAAADLGRSGYDVPHGLEEEAAGQGQRQRLARDSQSFSWQRVWSARSVTQVAAYRRLGSGRLLGSAADAPLRPDADRRQVHAGVLASLTRQLGSHNLKGGLEVSRIALRESFGFFVTDPIRGRESGLSVKALEFTRAAPFVFRDRAARARWSFYLQDSFRLGARLGVDAGVRFDHSALPLPEHQWSPRLGLSYRVWKAGTVLRASVNRFFQPPQIENLLLSSSAQARELSPFVEESAAGGAELAAERQTALEVGLTQPMPGGLRLDLAAWRRKVRNFGDPNVFFGTTLVFPNSVASGRASGLDLRLEVPERRGWSGYLSWSNGTVVQFGPINGGLFLEHETIEIGPGTRFIPDHDQRNVGAAGVTYRHDASGLWISFAGRHDSGTPTEVDDSDLDEILARPGAERVDFERGRVKPRTVWNLLAGKTLLERDRVSLSARVEILNLTGAEFAYNFGNPFSGTHFGAPRSLAVGVRIAVR